MLKILIDNNEAEILTITKDAVQVVIWMASSKVNWYNPYALVNHMHKRSIITPTIKYLPKKSQISLAVIVISRLLL
jgi:hypothetical protein